MASTVAGSSILVVRAAGPCPCRREHDGGGRAGRRRRDGQCAAAGGGALLCDRKADVSLAPSLLAASACDADTVVRDLEDEVLVLATQRERDATSSAVAQGVHQQLAGEREEQLVVVTGGLGGDGDVDLSRGIVGAEASCGLLQCFGQPDALWFGWPQSADGLPQLSKGVVDRCVR